MKMITKIQFVLNFNTHQETRTEAIPEGSTEEEVIEKAYKGFGYLEPPPVKVKHGLVTVSIFTKDDLVMKESVPS